MPDLSHRDIHDNASLAEASERQVWDSLNLEQRSQVLGQDIAGEANYSTNENSVYQRNSKVSSYESMSYSSLPTHVQTEVSNRLHTLGYFQETYGGTIYEVEGDNKYECKDCEEEFVSEEDLRVHRKVNHDNEESETESQEAYFRSLEIDPTMTKDNLQWARNILRGESARVDYPQNTPKGSVTDPPLPKGRREYDDNPNHYFYDNKLFKRGSRGGNYEQTGTALTEARKLIELEESILEKYGWESAIDVEKNTVNRQVFASEVSLKVNAEKLHPRTLKIIDSVNRPLLVNTLTELGARWGTEQVSYRGDSAKYDKDPHVKEEEKVIHQDYDPEHPHEHNDFDTSFGNKVAEEQEEETIDVKKYWGDVSDDEKDETVKVRKNWGQKEGEEQGYDDEEEIITSGGGEDSAIREIEDNYQRAHAQMKSQKDDPFQEYGYQKGQEEDTSDYEVDVDEYIKTGEPTQKLPTDTRSFDVEEEKSELEKIIDNAPILSDNDEKIEEEHVPVQDVILQESDGRTCPTCGFHTADEQKMHSHTQDHITEPEEAEEDFPFEKEEEETTVTAEPDLLQNVNIDSVEVEGEDDYDPEEKYDQKAEEAITLSNYIGNKTKGGESIDNILDGAIDVPEERETVEETIYNRKLDGYHEDKIARELAIYHNIEYEDAVEAIRATEILPTDKTAKTLFGKKYSELNQNEKGEMKILDGESRKRSTGDKNARR